MRKIKFAKVVASGNDFIIIEKNSYVSYGLGLASLVKNICDRRFGVGADGVLLLEKTKSADIRMRIFNADGSEAQMCGNGARATALYLRGQKTNTRKQRDIKIETKAGIIEGKVSGNNVKIRLTNPKDYLCGVPITINGKQIQIHSINTGVPHAVIFVEGIEDIDVSIIGRQVRYYETFAPAGTNVDFVEIRDTSTIRVRTYERGVEDETLACGTGAAASAIAYSFQLCAIPAEGGSACGKSSVQKNKIKVITQGGETLKVFFDKTDDRVTDVWLEGKAQITYKGEYYV